jgi:CRISPR-associated protein Cas1
MTRPGVDDTSPPEPTAGLPALADDPSEAGRDDGSPRLITLYLLEQHTLAGITGDRFVISRHGETLREILIRQVDQIVVFGNITLTTPFLDRCLTEGIPVYLLSAHGRYFGLVDNFDNASLLLLREQLARAADPTFSLLVAKELLRGKIHNGRTLLRRLSRRRASPELEEGILATGKILERIPGAPNGATLLGYEGTAARTLFAAYGAMVDPAWGFRGRNRQPPKDPINAMLSLGYTMLFQNTLSLIRIAGLHPHAGFLHAMTPGHPALASDLMEEHRAGVVDALVLDIALNGPLSPADFVLPRDAGDACLLTPDARKLFLRLLEARLLTRMEHPDHGRPVERRRIIESQARRLVAAIRANDPKLFKAWLQR